MIWSPVASVMVMAEDIDLDSWIVEAVFGGALYTYVRKYPRFGLQLSNYPSTPFDSHHAQSGTKDAQ